MARFAVSLFIVGVLLGACSPSPKALDTSLPTEIDPDASYLFYLHGKIIEDQGLPAISEEYGEYEYDAILKRFAESDFRVISELREVNADVNAYGEKLVGQIQTLMDAGVPAEKITVVGASKGAFIAIYASVLLNESNINYVLLGGCPADELSSMLQEQMYFHGNVLSIYDSADVFADSCMPLFVFSKGHGIGDYNEIVVDVGIGHGILYQPLDEWVLPTVEWSQK